MAPDTLRNALRASPFRPFTIEMSNGRRYRVPHPEFVALSQVVPLQVYVAHENGDAFLDVMQINNLEFENADSETPAQDSNA